VTLNINVNDDDYETLLLYSFEILADLSKNIAFYNLWLL